MKPTKTVTLCLQRQDHELSVVLGPTYTAEIVGYDYLQWTTTHLIIHMTNSEQFAYRADRIFELYTTLEKGDT